MSMTEEEIGAQPPVRQSRLTAEPRRATRSATPRKQALPEEFIDPETGKPFVRATRAGNVQGQFDLPKQHMKPGWDYQWEALKVLGEPVDSSVHAAMKANGWRPVQPSEFPGMMLDSWTGNTIERGNQILYKRPKYLSEEARGELKEKADKQMEDKFAQAQMAPKGTAPRHVASVKQEYEVLPADLVGGEVEEVE